MAHRPHASGSEVVQEVLTDLLREMPVLAPLIAREIRAQVPEYDRVPIGNHDDHVKEQQERVITALIEGRGPDEEDLRRAAALGRLRAAQGVSVAGVISAYHVGHRELWRLIEERADRGRALLPGLAGMLWESIHATATEIAAAHSSVARARHAQDLTALHRFVELLGRDQAEAETTDMAGQLGFDVDGPFLAGCIYAGARPAGIAQQVHERLEGLSGPAFSLQQGEVVLLLTQGPSESTLVELAGSLDHAPRAGIGLRRQGLAGARDSVRDAHDALLVTGSARRVASFAADWWLATVEARAERLAPVLDGAGAVVEANPHLVEAVQAYADCGFSIAAAAKQLHVHANSVAYRLDRWHQLTGWNPRTFAGLVHSSAACARRQGDD